MNIHKNARPTPFSRERGYVVGRPEGRRKRSLPRLTTSAAKRICSDAWSLYRVVVRAARLS